VDWVGWAGASRGELTYSVQNIRFNRIFCIGSLRDFERFLRACALHSANLLKKADRTREVDFVIDIGGKLELYEAKWTELPSASDAVNLDFVRNIIGKARITTGAVISRTPNGFPLPNSFRAMPLTVLK